MIPILFNTEDTEFNTNGIGRLTDIISCVVKEERNGVYECEFKYPITGRHYSDIQEERIIVCIHDDQKDKQPFRIYRRSAPIDGVVTFYAHHISYDLGYVLLEPFTASSVAQAFVGFSIHAINENRFDFWTNKSTEAAFTVSAPVSVKAILGGRQGSILDVFGGGEYKWDGFTVRLYQNRGTDSGVTIRYGKNLKDIKHEVDSGDIYNAVIPYWQSTATPGQDPVTVYGDLVIGTQAQVFTAPLYTHGKLHITTHGGADIDLAYPKTKAVPLDLSSEFTEEPTKDQLNAAAATHLASSDSWLPKENIKVDFVQLWQTEEYKDVAVLQRVGLCDTVSVYYPALGVTAEKQKVVKVTYDVIAERYTAMEIGTVSTTYAEVVTGKIEKQLEAVPTKDMMVEAINDATDLITGGHGGHVVFGLDGNSKPQEIYIMDTDDVNTAVQVLRINVNGIGFSSTGISGPYRSAWTLDGSFVADFITAGVINANLIRAGVIDGDLIQTGKIQSRNGKVYFDLDANELHCDNLVSTASEHGLGLITTTIGEVRLPASATNPSYTSYYGMITKYGDLAYAGIVIAPGQGANDYPSIVSGYNGVDFYSKVNNGWSSGQAGLHITDRGRMLLCGKASASLVTHSAINSLSFTDNNYGDYPGAILLSAREERNQEGGYTGYHDIRLIGWTHAGWIVAYNIEAAKVQVTDSLYVSGSKSRIAKTDSYEDRLLYCYETPSPMFGDIGCGETDAGGLCVVEIDDVFADTIAPGMEYQVFLQKEGQGDLWVSQKNPAYFIVEGTPGLRFSWEIKARQRGYEFERLERYEKDTDLDEFTRYMNEAANEQERELMLLIEEQEDLLYGEAA